MKNFKLLSVFIITLSISGLFAQSIKVLDNIGGVGYGSTLRDFIVSPKGDRFYAFRKSGDTILINGQQIVLGDTCKSVTYCPRYFLALDKNGDVSFVKHLGFSGGQMVLMDTSVVLFLVFSDDTLRMEDTMFVRPPGTFHLTTNMVALEYGFSGKLLRAKHWPADRYCRFGPIEVVFLDGNYYMSGLMEQDTLKLDGVSAPMVKWPSLHTDLFMAKLDGDWECQWIRSMGTQGLDRAETTDWDTDKTALITGWVDGKTFICGQDSIETFSGWGYTSMWVSKVDSSGNCRWWEEVKAAGSGHAARYLTDGSAVVAGSYYTATADFGDTVLYKTIGTTYYIAKYDQVGELVFARQFDSDISPSIRDMAITSEDAIWVAGSYSADDLVIGDLELPYEGTGGSDHDAFLLKLDKSGNPQFATAIRGSKSDGGYRMVKGDDNKIYLLVNTSSDTLWVNGEAVPNSSYNALVLLEIQDIATAAQEKFSEGVGVRLYPNPAAGGQVLNYEIKGAGYLKHGQFSLFSLYGQELGEFKITDGTGQIELPDLPNGMYLLQLKNKEGDILGTSKLVVD